LIAPRRRFEHRFGCFLLKLAQLTPIEHAYILRKRGRLPVAWPRDGSKRETMEGAGVALANQYRDNGLDTLHQHAQFEDGSVSVEAGLMIMLDRMRGGRFKVFDDVSNDWWEEFRLYHRKDGRAVKRMTTYFARPATAS